MLTEDQSETIAFLADPRSYPQAVDRVERIDTHSAIVFLAGRYAYKLKRAVLYDYLDFSTRAKRQAACDAELALNRRIAPDLYLDVVPITRGADGRLAFAGKEPPVDATLRMVRFDQDGLLDRMAARGQLSPALMEDLAVAVAAAHAAAPHRADHGGHPGMAWVIDGNADAFAEFGDILDPAQSRQMTERARGQMARHRALLEARRLDGHVRGCHGDLHLRNIVMFKGRPTLFDAVEFNDRISCIDVFYDAAFLIMDLWRLELKSLANAFFNRYMIETTDFGALPLLPLFLSCRSAVRAKTSATAARLQMDRRRAEDLCGLARAYLAASESFLQPRPPRLVAVGGLAGSGKSTVARWIAPGLGAAPGALIVRSDVVRKSIFGVTPTERLSEGAYAREASDRVYDLLRERAATALRAGHSVIVDAVCSTVAQRATFREVADAAGARFTGVWLEAPFDVAAKRIRERRSDASDATVDVLRAQSASDPGPIDWERVDASGERESVARRLETVLATPLVLR